VHLVVADPASFSKIKYDFYKEHRVSASGAFLVGWDDPNHALSSPSCCIRNERDSNVAFYNGIWFGADAALS